MAPVPVIPSDGQPEGKTQRLVLNALETFFRRPLIFLIPFTLMLAVGVFTAITGDKEYKSIGVMNVTSGSLLTDISQASNTPAFGFDPPATVTARSLNNLLQTHTFMIDVARGAGLTTALEQGLVTIDEMRASIAVAPNGDNLVAVWATTPRAEQSRRLAQATLDAFRNYNVSNDIADADVTIAVLTSRHAEYLERYQEAQQTLTTYILANPAPGGDAERPTEEQAEISRLSADLTRAQTQLSDVEAELDDARIAQAQAQSVSERKLRIVDPPTLPASPEPRVRDAAMTVAMFAAMGIILSAGFVLIAAVLDRSIRLPKDVSSRLGLDVLAVVPAGRQ